MKLHWKAIAAIACVILLCGFSALWFNAIRNNEKRLENEARESRARAERGDAKAQFTLGHLYFDGMGVPKDDTAAFHWYSESASQGYAPAQTSLGGMYAQGIGVTQNYGAAIRWYKMAADQGDSTGEYDLGSIYSSGLGVTQDWAQALDWYKRAAAQGDANGEYGLGYMLYYGRGTPTDHAKAAIQYRLAAGQGIAQAQYDLAYMTYDGDGVPINRNEAYRLFYMAAANGDPRARRSLARMNRGTWACNTIALCAGYLGSLLLLVSVFLRGKILSDYWLRFLAALVGLSYPGLGLYLGSNYRICWSERADYIAFLSEGFLLGLFLALMIQIHLRHLAKVVVGVATVSFISFNVYLFSRYDLEGLIPALKAFCLGNGFLIGVLSSLLILRWALRRKGTPDGAGSDRQKIELT